MYAKGLQLIPLSGDRFVLKRGVHEILLSGPRVREIAEPLIQLLDGSCTRDELLAVFPGDLRDDLATLVEALLRRGLILEHAPASETVHQEDPLRQAFFDNFPAVGHAHDTLGGATVFIVGINLISRAIVRSLLECGVGRIVLADHAILSNFVSPQVAPSKGSAAAERVVELPAVPDPHELVGTTLLCATSDFGEADALLEINRLSIQLGKPFLPAWVGELIGYVGPLNYPRETACLRCYRLRADSNDEQYDLRRAVRRFVTSSEEARPGVGLLTPMASIVGEIAAMEIIKSIVEYAPSNAVGRQIQINLVSFGSTTRRVLKVPRCPECSEQARLAPLAITHGPQIAQRDSG